MTDSNGYEAVKLFAQAKVEGDQKAFSLDDVIKGCTAAGAFSEDELKQMQYEAFLSMLLARDEDAFQVLAEVDPEAALDGRQDPEAFVREVLTDEPQALYRVLKKGGQT